MRMRMEQRKLGCGEDTMNIILVLRKCHAERSVSKGGAEMLATLNFYY